MVRMKPGISMPGRPRPRRGTTVSTTLRRNRRRRPTGARRATFAAVALMLGGGGLVAVNVYASATEGGSDQQSWPNAQVLSAPTVYCPDVGSNLTAVPDAARPDVDRELAQLD